MRKGDREKEFSERLDNAPLSRPEERVRFVLTARIDASEVSQAAIADRLQMSPSWVSHLIRKGNLLDDANFETVRAIEAMIGPSGIIRFAERVRDPASSLHRDVLADARWWNDMREQRFDNPVAVIVGGHSLLASPTLHSEPDWVERSSRHHLAFGLCRVATGAYGYSAEAITLLGRLAPALVDDTCTFMRLSPVGSKVARSLDRALRLYPNDDVMYATIANAARECTVDPADPSRLMHSLLLRRRLLHTSVARDDLATATELLDSFKVLIRDSGFPTRWRRFALWVLAEARHMPSPGGKLLLSSAGFARLTQVAANDHRLADITRVFADDTDLGWGPVARWFLPNNDIFLFDTRDALGRFAWSHDESSRVWLGRHLDPLLLGRRRPHRWRHSASERLMPRIHDALNELVTHPGLVRVQAAVEMILSAGPGVAAPTSRTLVEMLNDSLTGAAIPAGLVDNALYAVGVFRRSGATRDGRFAATWMPRHSHRFESAEHRASAVWAIGDLWAGHEMTSDVATALHTAFEDVSPQVRRAALHTAAALNATDLVDAVTRIAVGDPDGRTRDFARWCLLMWDPRTLAAPPGTSTLSV